MKLQAEKNRKLTRKHLCQSLFLLMHLHFFVALVIPNLSFLHHLHSLFLLMTVKSDNSLHSANMISNVGSCVDGLPKNFKSNETMIFPQSRQGRWIFFLHFMLKIPLLEIQQISLFLWAISLQWKTFSIFFSRLKASNTHLSIDFTLIKSLFSSNVQYFDKNLQFFSFHLPCQRDKRELSVKV